MEHNMDRLYWAAGVVLLGAIVLMGAKKFFPDLVSSIGAKLTKMVSNLVTETITPREIIQHIKLIPLFLHM
jgi:Sec-independent protein translocase protein TatA